jgi:hypothetical protein
MGARSQWAAGASTSQRPAAGSAASVGNCLRRIRCCPSTVEIDDTATVVAAEAFGNHHGSYHGAAVAIPASGKTLGSTLAIAGWGPSSPLRRRPLMATAVMPPAFPGCHLVIALRRRHRPTGKTDGAIGPSRPEVTGRNAFPSQPRVISPAMMSKVQRDREWKPAFR